METPNNEDVFINGGKTWLNADWLRQHVDTLVQNIQPDYFKSKRWFGSKGRTISNFDLVDSVLIPDQIALTVSLLLRFNYADGTTEFYHLPLIVKPEKELPPEIKQQAQGVTSRISTPEGDFAAYDALTDKAFCASLYRFIFEGVSFRTAEGVFNFRHVGDSLTASEASTVKLINTEQSNSSIVYDNQFILKCFRKLAAGKNPDLEIPLFLTTRTDFKYVPKLDGYIEYDQNEGGIVSLGSMQDFVQNIGDGYNYTLDQLRDYFKQLEPELTSGQLNSVSDDQRNQRAAQLAQNYAQAARQLGMITGELHNALASAEASQDTDFAPELITNQDVQRWGSSITNLIDQVLDTATKFLAGASPELRQQLESIIANKQDYLNRLKGLDALEQAQVNRIRHHGDYHLGQVLKTEDGFEVLDFEGEPARSLYERREKYCALKDVTGMLRSFDYAAYAILFEEQEKLQGKVADAELEKWALAWEQVVRQAFLDGYLEAAHQNKGSRYLPESPKVFQQALAVFETEKAFYELNYEINNRPNWIAIPLKGLQRINK